MKDREETGANPKQKYPKTRIKNPKNQNKNKTKKK
jgi:hypothetical protein